MKNILTAIPICFFLSLQFMPSFAGWAFAEQDINSTGQSEYFLGVFPFLPAATLEGVFAPIAAEISQKSGRKIHYRSASDFKKFSEKMGRQEFDIAFIQPFDFVGIAESAGYVPVAQRREPLSAIFVVKDASPLKGLSDLRGKAIAMAPKEAALSYIGKAALLRAGLHPGKEITIEHMKGHHSCLQQVLIGNVSACVTGRPALRVFENEMGLKMQILTETMKFPAMLFVVHSRVPTSDRKLIEETLLNTRLSSVEPSLRTLLMKDTNPPFTSTASENYDAIRAFWKELESD